MLILKRLKDWWLKWELFVNLKNSGIVGKFALLLIVIFPPISFVWFFFIPPNLQSEILSSGLFLAILSFFFSFFFTIFLIYICDFNFYIRLIVSLFVIYFALTPTINITPKIISVLSQYVIALSVLNSKNPHGNKIVKIIFVSLAISQFPPFLIEFSENIAINISLKFFISFLIFWFFLSIPPLSDFLYGLMIFTILSLNYLYPLLTNFQSYSTGFQLLIKNLWDILTIPLWILLAGDFVDEVGRLSAIIPQKVLKFLKSKKLLLIEIALVMLLTLLALVLVVFYSNSFFQKLQNLIPLLTYNLNYQLFLKTTIIFIAPIIFIISILSLFLLNKSELIELRNRFNQSLFALLFFSSQILYSYYFTNKSDIIEALSGFPFVLLALGLFWEPMKLFGQTTFIRSNYSIILAFILIISGILVDILLVLYPESVAQVSITYQIIGGIVVGFPILFLRIFMGWKYDEKFVFRNFFISFFLTLFPLVLFPNKYWLTIPLGLLISIVFKFFSTKQVSLVDFISLAFGAIAQAQVVWLLPLPIIPILQQWLRNLYQNVPMELFGKEHYIFLSALAISSISFFLIEKSKSGKNSVKLIFPTLLFSIISLLFAR